MQRYNATTRDFIFNVDKGVKTEAKNLLEGQRLIWLWKSRIFYFIFRGVKYEDNCEGDKYIYTTTIFLQRADNLY